MAYQDHIDWAWGNTQACGKPVCLFFKVWDTPPILRGPLSAHACVKAANVARSINVDLAARWLMAAQAHNAGAQNEIWDNKQAAVDYAFQKENPGAALAENVESTSMMAGNGNGAGNGEEAMQEYITPPGTIWQHAQSLFQGNKSGVTEKDLMEV